MNELARLVTFDDDRIIRGDIIKFIDGRWTKGGEPFNTDTALVVIGTRRILQRWQDQQLVESIIDEPLPDVEKLNDKIPRDEWGTTPDGNERAPWQLNYVVYFLDPMASIYTSINSTKGHRAAYERLTERIDWMRALQKRHVWPVVKLSAVKFTKLKMRPDWP